MHIVFKCNILIYACTLGSFLILFKALFCGDHQSLIHLVSFVLNDIMGVMIPCLCTSYSNAHCLVLCTNLGELHHIIQSNLLDLIIISIFLLVSSLWFIWLLASFVEASLLCYLFAIFDPRYSLISSEYSSQDMCI